MGEGDSRRAAMTNEQVGVVGKAFAQAYYASLVAGPATLRGFCGSGFKHLFKLHGREDITTHSPEAVQRFAARMGYDRCRVRIKSVNTMQVRANQFVVLVIGKIMCSRKSIPVGRKFAPSTVVKRRKLRKFSIVGTVFMFDDVTFENNRKNTVNIKNMDDDDCKLKSLSPPLTDTPSPVQKRYTSVTALKNEQCVHVDGLPNGFELKDFRTEFSRFGQIYGIFMVQSSKSKSQSAKHPQGTIWYDLAETADAVIQLGTVTLTNGHVVAVEGSK